MVKLRKCTVCGDEHPETNEYFHGYGKQMHRQCINCFGKRSEETRAVRERRRKEARIKYKLKNDKVTIVDIRNVITPVGVRYEVLKYMRGQEVEIKQGRVIYEDSRKFTVRTDKGIRETYLKVDALIGECVLTQLKEEEQ